MKYKNTEPAIFIERPNRFIANVDINGKTETVHVKNTGRCRELLIPGSKVILEKSDNPDRKTKYDLVAVYKENLGLVNIDSQAPNKVVKEWLESKPEIYILTPPPVFPHKDKILYNLDAERISGDITLAVRQLAKEKGLALIDMGKVFDGKSDLFSDGAHPTAEGAELFARTVFEAIK